MVSLMTNFLMLFSSLTYNLPMRKMKTVYLPNQVIRRKSQTVSLPLSEEDDAIAQHMIDYLAYAERPDNDERPGVGLAAVQLGYLKRMFYVNFSFEGTHYRDLLINPEIVEQGNQFAAIKFGEGCLSVPEDWPKTEGLVHRRNSVTVKGWSYFENKEVTYKLTNYPAIVFQHEMDHQDGRVFFDRIDQKNIWKWKNFEKKVF